MPANGLCRPGAARGRTERDRPRRSRLGFQTRQYWAVTRDDGIAAVPPATRPPRASWRGREVSDIVLVVVLPIVAMWVLCLTSPGRSLSVSSGIGIAIAFSAFYIPIMWLRIKP
jgi:hypothetical protein